MQTPTKTPEQTDLQALLADPEVVSNWVLEKYPAFAQAVLADLVNNSDVLKTCFEADNRHQVPKLAAILDDTDAALDRLAADPIGVIDSGRDPFADVNQRLNAYGLTDCGAS